MLFIFPLAAYAADPIEEALNEYEQFVIKYEGLAQKSPLSEEEWEKVWTEASQFVTKPEIRKNYGKGTSEQRQRWSDLQERNKKSMRSINNR
jgi:hypothetical protein